MFAKTVTAIFATIVVMFASGAAAQKIQSWKYHGKISWTHPDGRVINGVYANTLVDNDRLSIIRDTRTGRSYIQFLFVDRATLLERQARFFILNGPDRKTAGRVYFEVDASVRPGSGATAGVIVSQLTKADLKAISRNSGNLIGASYWSIKDSDTSARSRSYMFSGRGLAATVLALNNGANRSTRRPAVSSNPRPPSSTRTANYFPYKITWQNCSRPRIRRLRTSSAARRFVASSKRYVACRKANSTRIRNELSAHVRRQGGTFKSRLVNKKYTHTFGPPRGCFCREEFSANVRSTIRALDDYVGRSNRFVADSNRVIRRFNRGG